MQDENLKEFAQIVFGNPYKDKDSIKFVLADETLEEHQGRNMGKVLFDIFLSLMLIGVEILFHKNLIDLTGDQIRLLIKYMESVGVSPKVHLGYDTNTNKFVSAKIWFGSESFPIITTFYTELHRTEIDNFLLSQ